MMIKLTDGVFTGSVKGGDNYSGLCCDGYDCTVELIMPMGGVSGRDELIFMKCHNDAYHNEMKANGNRWSGRFSCDDNDIARYLAGK